MITYVKSLNLWLLHSITCRNVRFYRIFDVINSQFSFLTFIPGDHPAAMYHEHRSAATTVYRKSGSSYRDVLLLLFLSILLPFYNANCNSILSIFTDKLSSFVFNVQKECPNHQQSQKLSSVTGIVVATQAFSSMFTRTRNPVLM